jgi:hypothetical protein
MRPKIWILYLIPPGRFGLLFTGLLIFAVMTVVFVAMEDVRTLFTSGALFFCAMPAYMVPVFGYINRISVQAVADLHDLLDMPQEELLRFQRTLSHRSLAWNILVTGAGQLPDHARLEKINNLLDHRQHMRRVSDWPLDIGALSRLGFYLIIPPLTWIGAALIENIVDALL